MYPYAASLLPLKAWPGEHPSRPCLLLLPTARVPVAGLSLNEVRSLVDQGEAVVFRNVDNLSGEDVERVRASVAPASAALHIKRAGGINPGVPNKDNEGLVFGVQAAKVMGSKEKARVVFDNELGTALLGVGKTAADGNGVTNLRIGVVHPNSDGSFSLHTLLPGSLAHSVTVMNTQVAASGMREKPSGQGANGEEPQPPPTQVKQTKARRAVKAVAVGVEAPKRARRARRVDDSAAASATLAGEGFSAFQLNPGEGQGSGEARGHTFPQAEAFDLSEVLGLIPPVGEPWEDKLTQYFAELDALLPGDREPEHAAAFLNAGGNDQGVPQQGAILSAHDELEWAGDLL